MAQPDIKLLLTLSFLLLQIEGENGRVPLPFQKVIYVMEDVDAASHVVQRRGTQQTAAASNNKRAAASVSGWLEGAGRYDMAEVEEVEGNTRKDAVKELRVADEVGSRGTGRELEHSQP